VTTPRLCVIGDTLLDIDWEGEVRRVCRDSPAPVVDAPTERSRPGGAGLSAVLAAEAGAQVTLVTALSDDDDGRRVAQLLARAGVAIVDLGLPGPTPVKLRLRSSAQSLARVDRGCEPVVPPGPWTRAAAAAAADADAILVSDYGRGIAALPAVVGGAPGGDQGPPVVWDPHSAGPVPPAAAALVTPNESEACLLAGSPTSASTGGSVPALVDLAIALAARLGCAVAVTAGERGAVLVERGRLPVVVPTPPAQGDVCGAGDAFATRAALVLAGGGSRRQSVEAGVAAAHDFVAGRAGDGSRAWPEPDRAADGGTVVPLTVAAGPASSGRATRRSGGVVVAAGGCFDVLHAGHVRLLEHARGLGDQLVVLLNSDDSVRRLKGPGRPLNTLEDRAAVLRSLACVDDVIAFDEATPCSALADLRPHLFVKGADYEGADLEEREVMARWGGQVVLVPLVEGRSTTRLIHIAAAAGA